MNGSVKFGQHSSELLYVGCHIRPGSLEHCCSDDCPHFDACNLHPLIPLPEPGYQRGGLPESIGRLYGHDENARGESPAEQTSLEMARANHPIGTELQAQPPESMVVRNYMLLLYGIF